MDENNKAILKVLAWGILFFIIVIGLYYAGFLGDNSNAPGIKKSTFDSGDNMLQNQTIPDSQSVQKQNTGNNFGSYDCTYDCSGHSAGYEWAEENNICDPYYSGGNSESFSEGVRQWTDENC